MDSLDGAGDRAPRESGGEGASGAPSVLALSALALLLAALPYIAGFLAARRGEVFLGALNNLGDTGQYLAALRQGMGGQLLYVNQYTSVRVAPALIYPLYTAFGFLCAPLHVSPLAVYTLLRAIAAVALLAALRGLCRAVCPTRAVLPFALALFGGGLYVPVLLLSPLVRLPFAPVALTAPEFSLFAMLLNSPHGTLGLAAELWGLTGYLRWRRERDPRGGAMLAAGGLALGLCYPFGLAVLLPVVGVDSVLAFFGERRRPTPGADAIRGERRRRPSGADVMLPALALLPAFGLALYYATLFRYDPHWGASGMLRLPPPSVPVLAAAFGPLVALALPIVWRQARPRSPGGTSGLRLMTVWAIVTPLLLLLPVPQSERLLSGWSVALALLGAASLGRLGARRARRARRYVLLLSLSNVMLALLYLAVALGGGGSNRAYYAPAGEAAAVRWLARHAGPNDVVMASAGSGNLIVAAASCRVVVGQNFETINLGQAQRDVARFYDPATGGRERAAIVRRQRVTLALAGPYERALGGFVPYGRGYRGYRQVFSDSAGTIRVFAVEGT